MYSVVQRDSAPAGSPLIVNLCFISISFSASRMVMVAVGLSRFQKPLSNSYVWRLSALWWKILGGEASTDICTVPPLFTRFGDEDRDKRFVKNSMSPGNFSNVSVILSWNINFAITVWTISFSSDHEHLLMFTNNNEERMSRNRWSNRWLFRKVLQNIGGFSGGGVGKRRRGQLPPPPPPTKLESKH